MANLAHLALLLEGQTITIVGQETDEAPVEIHLANGSVLYLRDTTQQGADGGSYAALELTLKTKPPGQQLQTIVWTH